MSTKALVCVAGAAAAATATTLIGGRFAYKNPDAAWQAMQYPASFLAGCAGGFVTAGGAACFDAQRTNQRSIFHLSDRQLLISIAVIAFSIFTAALFTTPQQLLGCLTKRRTVAAVGFAAGSVAALVGYLFACLIGARRG